MGITDKSIARLSRYDFIGCTMLQIGCQNIYTEKNYGAVAHDYFNDIGIITRTIDITGCQGAEVMDLREKQDWADKYDIVTDFGCGEHVDGDFYTFNKNIHDACKVGGIIIRENPKTGHWPGHGCNYVDMEFYKLLAEYNGYEILELCEEYAMGNVTDGCNISVVLKRVHDVPFIAKYKFEELGHVYKS